MPPHGRIIIRIDQPHALGGICCGDDPGVGDESALPFAFTLLALLLDAKSPARTVRDILDFDFCFGLGEDYREPEQTDSKPGPP